MTPSARHGRRSQRPSAWAAFALALALVWLSPPAAGDAAALDPPKALTEYSLASWQTAAGLPHNTVQALAQTRDGYVWVGTVEGLARFDGVRFVAFDRSNTPAIARNDIQALFESRDGSLWIALYGGGLVRYREGAFRPYGTGDGLHSSTVTAIHEDREGSLWIWTDGTGLYRLKSR